MGWLERSVCLGLRAASGGLRQRWDVGGGGTELEED